ncbi:hypothetical protein AVEN_266126-1 [Araneus ventricosus]|uniref:Uncharacterized protein n=1 Tax=Araneus ventricosus TaxID=182803 RepID=A0A4Y2G8U4_ARAVE|nr:hypothetical protein AVEN_266126-1 [Araneus ventricosus]
MNCPTCLLGLSEKSEQNRRYLCTTQLLSLYFMPLIATPTLCVANGLSDTNGLCVPGLKSDINICLHGIHIGRLTGHLYPYFDYSTVSMRILHLQQLSFTKLGKNGTCCSCSVFG